MAAAYGIANERRWGYGLGVAMAGLAVVLALIGSAIFRRNIIGLMFDIALLALLLHPQSRDYQRIWFKAPALPLRPCGAVRIIGRIGNRCVAREVDHHQWGPPHPRTLTS